MIEQKYIELMNLDLDNEINREQKIILNDYINSNKEGREYFEELSAITNSLNSSNKKMPSENIKKNILNMIDDNKYVKKSKNGYNFASFSKFISKNMVLSFGTVAAAVLIAFLIFNNSDYLEVGSQELSGTIASPNELLVENSEEIILNQDGIIGTVNKQYFNKSLNIVFSFQADNSSNFDISFDKKHLKFGDFIENYPKSPKFTLNEDNISIAAFGKMNFMLTFKKISHYSSANDISIILNGKKL